MSFNYNKLRGRIVEKGYLLSEFAKAMGVSQHTLSFKLNNKIDFKQSEIIKIIDILEIDPSQIDEYFFDC